MLAEMAIVLFTFQERQIGNELMQDNGMTVLELLHLGGDGAAVPLLAAEPPMYR